MPDPTPSSPTIYERVLDILRIQGAAVLFMLWALLMASGIIPNKLCQPTADRDQVIAAMEKDRQSANTLAANDRAQVIAALNKIGDILEATQKATNRMDSRDAIKTCASIPDKEARIQCIQVAVTGK